MPEPEKQKELLEAIGEVEMLVDLDGWIRNVEDNIACCESIEELKEVEESAEADYPRVPKGYSDRAKAMFEQAKGD